MLPLTAFLFVLPHLAASADFDAKVQGYPTVYSLVASGGSVPGEFINAGDDGGFWFPIRGDYGCPNPGVPYRSPTSLTIANGVASLNEGNHRNLVVNKTGALDTVDQTLPGTSGFSVAINGRMTFSGASGFLACPLAKIVSGNEGSNTACIDTQIFANIPDLQDSDVPGGSLQRCSYMNISLVPAGNQHICGPSPDESYQLISSSQDEDVNRNAITTLGDGQFWLDGISSFDCPAPPGLKESLPVTATVSNGTATLYTSGLPKLIVSSTGALLANKGALPKGVYGTTFSTNLHGQFLFSEASIFLACAVNWNGSALHKSDGNCKYYRIFADIAGIKDSDIPGGLGSCSHMTLSVRVISDNTICI